MKYSEPYQNRYTNMNVRQEYNQYVMDNIRSLLKEELRPLRFYRIVEIVKNRIGCSERDIKEGVQELLNNRVLTRTEEGEYIYNR